MKQPFDSQLHSKLGKFKKSSLAYKKQKIVEGIQMLETNEYWNLSCLVVKRSGILATSY